MATKTITLLDVAQGTFIEQLNLQPADVGGAAKGYQITARRLHGGLSEGVDEIRVNNGAFTFSVLPTRGMSIWKAWHGKQELGWQSPVHGPVHPAFVPVAEPSGLGWLDGFDELLVRCGLESNGAPEFDDETGRLKYPLHGRIGNKPAHHVTVSVDGETGEIIITGSVDETRFHFLKVRLTTTIRTKVGQPGFQLRDEVTNLSGSPAEIQMLYHVNFGEPLLDAGSRLVAAAKTIVPRNDHAAESVKSWDHYAAPQPGFQEQVYFFELLGDAQGQTQTLLKNAHGTRGVSLTFNNKQLPCFTLWKNTTSSADGTVTGIEPGTNFPNPRSYEGKQGRVVKLAAGGRVAFDLGLISHSDAASVESAERAIQKLQAGGQPKIHDKPQPGWCAD
ncbi:MAG: aldose 1-epimerase family protein [Planctomycetota bacterium]